MPNDDDEKADIYSPDMYFHETKGPFSKPFFNILFEKFPKHRDQAWFDISEIFKILNSNEYLAEIPRYANARETYANVQLISASLILFCKNLLTFKQVSNAVTAFQLAAKETRLGERIPLDAKSINNALWLMNLSMGDTVIQAWLERVDHWLEYWSNHNRLKWE